MKPQNEMMFRMEAMRAAGLVPDMLVTADTLAPDRNGNPTLITNPRWRDLYTSNIAVHLAYDQLKFGRPEPKAEPTITTPPPQQQQPKKPEPKVIDTTFVDITPVPERPREPMSRSVLIATARGHAITFGTKDAYFAWLLTELADQLEAAVDPEDFDNLSTGEDE